ncbi:hypothetical protein DL770_007766 [Monosporascus sp. CRB-9-2]|nr:hypothetical protein DL770_007766 [Monosporascus sp. CRB-9-2]
MPPTYERREKTPDATESTEIVTIHIPSGEKFHIHAHILAHHSKYFRAELKDPTKEAAKLCFHLTKHAIKFTVTFFVKWLYVRPTLGHNLDAETIRNIFVGQENQGGILDKLCSTWLLGDYLQAPEFKNLVLVLLNYMSPFKSIRDDPLRHLCPCLGAIDPTSKLHDFLVASLASLMGDSEAMEMTGVDVILERLDADTKTKLLRRFALHTQEVRKTVQELRTHYRPVPSRNKLRADKFDETLQYIAKGGVSALNSLEDYLEEEEEHAARVSLVKSRRG